MTTTAISEPTTPVDPDAGGQPDGAALQDATQQQLSLLPQVDGKTRTRLRVSISGTLELEAHDQRDAELARILSLGDKVELELVANGGSRRTGLLLEFGCDDKADKVRRSNDGYIEDIVHTVRLRALSITHPVSEADQIAAQGR